MITRWHFISPYTGERIIIDNLSNYEGVTWVKPPRARKKKPHILIDGMLVEGRKQNITQNASVKCSYGCKHAAPWTDCVCICGGKQHGIEYSGPYHKLEEENVSENVWLD